MDYNGPMAKSLAALKAVGTELLAFGFAQCLYFYRQHRHTWQRKSLSWIKNGHFCTWITEKIGTKLIPIVAHAH
jgi:hypothetical protein